MKLSTPQRDVLRRMASTPPPFQGWGNQKTMDALLTRGLVQLDTSQPHRSYWSRYYLLTEAGRAALETADAPVRAPGRPSKYADRAHRQQAYRERVGTKQEEMHWLLSRLWSAVKFNDYLTLTLDRNLLVDGDDLANLRYLVEKAEGVTA